MLTRFRSDFAAEAFKAIYGLHTARICRQVLCLPNWGHGVGRNANRRAAAGKGIFFLRVKPDRTQARAAWRLAWSNAPSRRCACLTRWHETSFWSGARRAQGSHVGPSIEARERSAHGARSRARPPQKVRGRLISSSRYTDDARRMPRPTHKVAAWQGIFCG